jgi:hypothetical protein
MAKYPMTGYETATVCEKEKGLDLPSLDHG